MTLHLTIQNNKVAEVLQIPIERTIPWDNKIIPDTIGVYVATKSVEPESTEPYITDIKVFMADLEKLISENQLYEEGITIIKNNEFVDTIKYYALYDVKESSKNCPTETDTIIGNGYLINGRYEGNVEILLSAGDNLTRRLLFPFQTKNNSFKEENVKVDAVICDPPYVINYADWDKEFNMPLAIDLCYDLLKDDGNLILFQGWSNVAKTKELLDEKFTIQNWIVWDRIKGRGAKKNFVSTREDILWYCKGNNPTYNKIYSNIPKKTGGMGKKNGQECRALTNVWYDISPIVPWSPERNGHPTQKPLQLMERCVTIWTNEGDTVLDFTMGSGTTGGACVNLSRNFIGIESDKQWFDVADKRINK